MARDGSPPRFNRNLILFLIGTALLGSAGGMFETTFNNFVSDTFNIGADIRGKLEFPRELPGFLTALFAGLLFFLPETYIASACAFAVGLGLLGLGFLGDRWATMLTFMVLWSCGSHLLMPVRSSIAMGLADEKNRGRRLGEIRGAAVGAGIVGCGIVWLSMRHLSLGYPTIFFIAGGTAVLAGFVFLGMRLPEAHLRRPRFVWNRRYWLFYVLALLFGARKQMFITFGPWVLVRVFNQPAYTIAQLWIVGSVLGIGFQPWLGRVIDKYGPRRVLMIDALCILTVCIGYGFSSYIGNRSVALWLLYVCFVGDQLLFGVNMAREIYLSRIVTTTADLAPTLSLGITINHAVSMTLPILGGYVWEVWGHSQVFFGAAIVAFWMYVVSGMIPPAPGTRN